VQLRKPTTKAVILARGLGTRMRREDARIGLSESQASAADSGLKGMIPIARPFLDYVISALADAGITDVCLISGGRGFSGVLRHASGSGRDAAVVSDCTFPP